MRFSGAFSNVATVYSTPANGLNKVLTHMSNLLYASLAYFLTTRLSTFIASVDFERIDSTSVAITVEYKAN